MPGDAERLLLRPCRQWLQEHLRRQHKRSEVLILPDSDRCQLRHALVAAGLHDRFPESSAWEIKVDVVAVVAGKRSPTLALVELKASPATLRDVGQLLGYCRVCRPTEAFLLSSKGISTELQRLLTVYGRTDILEFDRRILRVGKWDSLRNAPDWGSMIPGASGATL